MLLQMSLDRPELFPLTTEQRQDPSMIDYQLEEKKYAIMHPLSGIHSEEDWEAFKAKFALALLCLVVKSE
jgi:hypothetical protein